MEYVSPRLAAADASTRRPEDVLSLTALHKAAEKARGSFAALVATRFPGRNQWDWFRALHAVKGEPGRRNDDQSHDVALAADPDIKAAHDAYIEKLHRFYRAWDGEHGVLGGRGL